MQETLIIFIKLESIFVADESGLPFAEMSQEAKNAISHRGRAMRKLIEYLA